jgi:hypothetical protein
MTFDLRGRAAIASIPHRPSFRAARLAEARRMVRRLELERMPYADALASLLAGAVACAAHDRVAATTALRTSIDRLEGVHMAHFAASAPVLRDLPAWLRPVVIFSLRANAAVDSVTMPQGAIEDLKAKSIGLRRQDRLLLHGANRLRLLSVQCLHLNATHAEPLSEARLPAAFAPHRPDDATGVYVCSAPPCASASSTDGRTFRSCRSNAIMHRVENYRSRTAPAQVSLFALGG